VPKSKQSLGAETTVIERRPICIYTNTQTLQLPLSRQNSYR